MKYRCLECGKASTLKKMTVVERVGDREGHATLPVVPGNVQVDALVCRFCQNSRRESNPHSPRS